MFAPIARPGAGLFFVAVLLGIVLSAGRTPISADANVSLRAAQLWLTTGSMALHDDDFRKYNLLPSPDGKRYSKYPLLAFVNSVPAAWWLRHFGGIDQAPGFAALALVPAAWGASLALGIALLLARLGISWRAAMGLSCLLLVSSPLLIYARSYYGEMSQAALLVWTLLFAHLTRADKRCATLAGVAAGLAVAAKPTLIVIVPCVALALPARDLMGYGLGLLPGAALVAGYNFVRYDSVLAFGYGGGRDGTLGFATPLLVGLFGNFFSPGKSVFLYAPVLMLAPWGAWHWPRGEGRFWGFAWATPLTAIVVLVSTWWAWSGDMAWGPRLLVPVIPWLALPALLAWTKHLRARVTLLVLGALGLLAQLPALLLSDATYWAHIWRLTRPAIGTLTTTPNEIADDVVFLHYVPWMSPLVGQWWLLWQKLFGVASAGVPPWSHDGFDRIADAPTASPWNLWFDGSGTACVLAAVLLLAIAALTLRLRQVTQPVSQASGGAEPSAG